MFKKFNYQLSSLFLLFLCFSYNFIDICNNIYCDIIFMLFGIFNGFCLVEQLSIANKNIKELILSKKKNQELLKYIYNNFIETEEDIDKIESYKYYLNL